MPYRTVYCYCIGSVVWEGGKGSAGARSQFTHSFLPCPKLVQVLFSPLQHFQKSLFPPSDGSGWWRDFQPNPFSCRTKLKERKKGGTSLAGAGEQAKWPLCARRRGRGRKKRRTWIFFSKDLPFLLPPLLLRRRRRQYRPRCVRQKKGKEERKGKGQLGQGGF